MGRIIVWLLGLYILISLLKVIAVVLVLGVLVAIVWAAGSVWAEGRSRRRACPTCQNWIDSVLLTELDPDRADRLCEEHVARWSRLKRLEEAVFADQNRSSSSSTSGVRSGSLSVSSDSSA